MDNAAVASMQGAAGASGVDAARSATGPQMPLSFLRSGEAATIARVRGRGDLHHHLENMGFVEGARVTVVSEVRGDLIVEIKGTQVALNKQVASRIIANSAA